MLVFDTNVLLHAADERSDLHAACRRRLDDARRDSVPAYLTWSVCYEFLRVPAPMPRADPVTMIRLPSSSMATSLVEIGADCNALPENR